MTATTKTPMHYTVSVQWNKNWNAHYDFKAANDRIATWVATSIGREMAHCIRQDGKIIPLPYAAIIDPADEQRIIALMLGLPRTTENPIAVFAKRNSIALGAAVVSMRARERPTQGEVNIARMALLMCQKFAPNPPYCQ